MDSASKISLTSQNSPNWGYWGLAPDGDQHRFNLIGCSSRVLTWRLPQVLIARSKDRLLGLFVLNEDCPPISLTDGRTDRNSMQWLPVRYLITSALCLPRETLRNVQNPRLGASLLNERF